MNPIETKPQFLAHRMFLAAICSVLLGLCAASCGQRGPLYLPDESGTAGRSPDATTREQGTASGDDEFGVNEVESLPEEDAEEDEATS